METKTNWPKTMLAYLVGIINILFKLFFLDVPFHVFNNFINALFFTRATSYGVINRFRKTIHQAPNLSTKIKYITTDYNKDRNKVRDMVTNDFKKLVLESLKKYPIAYIDTNNFVYKNVLLRLQEDGLITVEKLKGYKAPQVMEKVQIMNRGAVVRCFWDMRALKRLFRMEEIYRYQLKKVATI